MESVSIKFEEDFVQDMNKLMKKHRYATKTEFIREAIRDKMKDLEKQEALIRLRKLHCASKRKTTDKQLGRAKDRAFVELEKELR